MSPRWAIADHQAKLVCIADLEELRSVKPTPSDRITCRARDLSYPINYFNPSTDEQKCDLAVPSCVQCLRAGKACEGYRNKIDSFFRDQTKEVAVKAQGTKHKRISTSDTHVPQHHLRGLSVQVPTLFHLAESSTSYRPQCSLARTPSLSVEDQATRFFFSKYGARQSSEQRRSLYEYLPELYNVDTENSSLRCIITAVGLAGLSHRRTSSEMLLAATASYNLALHQTNYALQHPMTASSDQTLISILLLGLYEASPFLPR
jgi:hypothetical protein